MLEGIRNAIELKDLIAPAILGVLGFLAKGFIDKRKEKKEEKEEEAQKNTGKEKLVKRNLNIIFAKGHSIDRDLVMLHYACNEIYTHKDDEGFMESIYYQYPKDMIDLCINRFKENLADVKKADLSVIEEYDEQIASVAHKYINRCENIRRVIDLKTDGEEKNSLLKDIGEQIHKTHMELLSITRKLYSTPED